MTRPVPEAPAVICEALDQTVYFDELRQRIDGVSAGGRIALLTMGFDPREEITASVMDAAYGAAQRGAAVHVATDAYAFMIDDRRSRPGPLFLHGQLPEQLSPVFQPRLDALHKLGAYASGYSGIVNKPARPLTLPYAGRSHIKGAVVDDWVALGGCNLDHTERLNTMVTTADERTANRVFDLFADIIQTESTETLGAEDIVYSLDSTTDLIVDAGTAGHSKIMDTALEMIDDADKWVVLSSQFMPAGDVVDHLVQAINQGKQVDILYNHPNKLGKLE